MVHGNVHPGTVMIGDDGRVVLADARADDDGTTPRPTYARSAASSTSRSPGTGRTPRPGTSHAARRRTRRQRRRSPRRGRCAPACPAYLDDLTMDLLDSRLAPPAADVLAAELGRLDSQSDEQYFDDSVPLRFTDGEETACRRSRPAPAGRKIAIGVAALLVDRRSPA